MIVKRDHVQLFILFQECSPVHFYTKKAEVLMTEEDLKKIFQDLDTALECIQIENYDGFFDVDNINAFLSNCDMPDGYYLVSPRRRLQRLLNGWISWRQKRESNHAEEYKIEKAPSNDNSFGEVHARKARFPNNKYLIVSHDAICFHNRSVHVEKVSDASAHQIECRALKKELKKWFDHNRIPPRTYHASPKHGENGKGEHHGASKLLCSHADANIMLSKAIGMNGIRELYYYDENHKAYIVFRYEGNIGTNQFHAYHLSEKDQVGQDIKRILECVLSKHE